MKIDPLSVRIARGGKDRQQYVADLDDLSFDFWKGRLHIYADVSATPNSSKATKVSIEFTPAALSQLAAAAVCADNDDEYLLPF